ncbi:hypothetical protein [Methylobacterium gnaphalii]|uniref:Uncharacterized protein n=1 Tax=Methylobacterium gnaphalii TaxID=1010610 RepID=A0A512JI46_9HYPH|nr:hypothetical protein [Methylobacterium gnaphalii]GEP09552.1 hypothetical protein MGN01_13970 [Methylobacterium gnaphalii]GJD69930.1 hypothetical protein MMMDOFMJ_2869 [Methylobacterium gnaphalii]GLS48150.1 hypothetical protein GCM10007885_09940 [Methylobacterium gnaphalii]
METLLILGAVAVAGLALAFASVVSARSRRPPLRMQREDDLAEGDEDFLIRTLRPAPRSPIDRSQPIVDAEWSEVREKDGHVIDAASIEAEMIEAKLIDDSTKARPDALRGRRGQ